MSTFAIVLHAPIEDGWHALTSTWPGRSFIMDDTHAFVAPEGLTLTSDIATALGLNPNTGRTGIVLEFNSYAGLSRPDFWEWLNKVRV